MVSIKLHMIKYSILLMILFSCLGTATASIYTVGTGSGYNYTTINAAVYNASPGDTILVSDGTYTENINISKPLTVISENGLTTTVINSSSGNDVLYIDNTSHVTISGFNITGAGDDMAGIYLASVYSCNISGNLIYNNYFGIYLENSTDNILTGNIINSSGWDGISLYSSSENNTMIDNIISYTGCDGIYLDYSGNNTLINNTIIDNPESGINVYYSLNNIINSNIISNNSDCGIYLESSGNSTLTGNLMSSNDYNFRVNGSELANFLNDIDLTNLVNGEPLYYWIDHSDEQVPSDAGLVCVINSTNITVRDIELTQGYAGVLFAYTDNSIIYNVTASENYYGVHLFSSSFNTIDNITANNNTQQGICITSSSNDISIANNIIRSNGVLGMSISYSDNSTLVNNTLSSNFFFGIMISYSNNNILTDNNASSNFVGIYLGHAGNNTLMNNTANSNIFNGISLIGSNDNTLINSTTNSNGYAILLGTSDNNTFTNTTVSSNDNGIFLERSKNSTFSNSTISSNDYSFAVEGSELGHFLHDIDQTNQIDGKPVYYWVNVSDAQVPSNAGLVCVVNSMNITVRDIGLTKGYDGVLFAYTNDSTIQNVTVSENNYGVHLVSSSNNVLDNITASNNDQYGIYLSSSSNYNTLTNNVANSNAGTGIRIRDSINGILTGNHAIGNGNYGFDAVVNSTGLVVIDMVLTNSSAQVSFVTDTSDIRVRGIESSSAAFSGKTNVNGYVNITRSDGQYLDTTFSYNDSVMSSNDESTVSLFRLSGSDWVEVPDALLNTTGNYVSANISEFGIFGLFRTSESSDSGVSSVSDDSSVAARVRSQGTITDLHVNEDGEITAETVVKSSDAKTTITFEKGTIALDPYGNPVDKIIVTVPASLPSDVPADVVNSGLYFDFGPSGTTFNKDVMITIDFDPDEFEGKAPIIYTYISEGGWIAMETTVDWESGKATAMISHFSLYALFKIDAEVEYTVAEVIEKNIEVSILLEEGEPVVDGNNFSYIFWISVLGFALVLGIVLMKKQKDSGGL